MKNEITTIPLLAVEPGALLVRPDPDDAHVSEQDPAVDVMTDFSKVVPVTIDAHAGLHEALEKMKAHGIRLLLVTGENETVVGVITAYDIQSEKPTRYGHDNDIPVNDIETGMIMTPIASTPALDYAAVKQALVRHVIETMKDLDRPHTLVIEDNNATQHIRGVFSTSRISKLLGRPVYRPLHAAHSLADMQLEISRE